MPERLLASHWMPFVAALPFAFALRGLVLAVPRSANGAVGAAVPLFVLAAVALLFTAMAATSRASIASLRRVPVLVAAFVIAWAPTFGLVAVEATLADGPRADLSSITFRSLAALGWMSFGVGLVLAAFAARFASSATLVPVAIASVVLAGALSITTTLAPPTPRSDAFASLRRATAMRHALAPGDTAPVLGRTLAYVDTHAHMPPADGEGCRLEGLDAPIHLRGCPRLDVSIDEHAKLAVVEWGTPRDVPAGTVEWPLVAFRADGSIVDVTASYVTPRRIPTHAVPVALAAEGLAVLLLVIARRRRHEDEERIIFGAVALATTVLGAAPLAVARLFA